MRFSRLVHRIKFAAVAARKNKSSIWEQLYSLHRICRKCLVDCGMTFRVGPRETASLSSLHAKDTKPQPRAVCKIAPCIGPVYELKSWVKEEGPSRSLMRRCLLRCASGSRCGLLEVPGTNRCTVHDAVCKFLLCQPRGIQLIAVRCLARSRLSA